MLDTGVFRKRLITELAIGIGGSLALVLLTSLVSSDALGRAEHVRAIRTQEATAKRSIETLASLGALSDELPAYQARMDAALPPAGKREQAVLNLKSQLEASAKAKQLTWAFSFGAQSPASVSGPGSITFTITLEGAFDSIMAFTRELERTTPLVGVDSVELSRKVNTFGAHVDGKLFTR